MDIKDVENLARLARIELNEEEKESMLKDMDSILGYVKQIERPSAELPATDVDGFEASLSGSTPPATSGTGTSNVWREDLPAVEGEIIPRELITGQFPDAQDGFLKVKKIL